MSNLPKVSIITVAYNCAPLIERTLASVAGQTYPNIEYIVVDGASTDGTTDVIKAFRAHIDHFVSEPDRGIYDAMNKGLRLATGDYVWFVNAGDTIHRPDTLEQIMARADANTDVLYGEVLLTDDSGHIIGSRSDRTTQKTPHNLTWKSLKYGMVVSHQAFIARRAIAPPYMEGNLAADIDWVIRILKRARRTHFVPVPFALYLMGGTSKKRHLQSLKDRYKVLRTHYGTVPNLIHHLYITLRAVRAHLTGKAKY